MVENMGIHVEDLSCSVHSRPTFKDNAILQYWIYINVSVHSRPTFKGNASLDIYKC